MRREAVLAYARFASSMSRGGVITAGVRELMSVR